MITAKDFGKAARINKINAPTLDQHFLNWLKAINAENRIHHFVQWWEGWYEVIDESLSLQESQLNKRKSQSIF
jgi:hypothetical protein